MSKKEKLVARLLSTPKDFTFSEAETLFSLLGFVFDNKGKTSGSRARFKKGDMAYCTSLILTRLLNLMQ